MSCDRQDSAARYVMRKKKKSKPGRRLIEAAGGIVMRGRVRPLFAVVQLRRQRTWVLPKGKLNRDETALVAARREAIFQESVAAERTRGDALSKRFEEALKQARQEPVTKPTRDFDLD